MSNTNVIYHHNCSPEEWAEFITAMHSGEVVQIDREMYYYWLEVLPPVFMNQTVKIGGVTRRLSFGFAEGEERIIGFWLEFPTDGTKMRRFFCQRTDLINRPNLTDPHGNLQLVGFGRPAQLNLDCTAQFSLDM